MNTQRSPFGSLLLLPLLMVAACGAPEEDEAMGAAEEAEAPAETAPVEEMETEPPGEVSVTLETLNESGVTGTAVATHEGESVVVEVEVQGAPDVEELAAHIHEGDCASGGPVLVPLETVTVADGTGTSSTTLTADQVPAGQAAYIQVHGPEGQPVACGDLQGHGSGM